MRQALRKAYYGIKEPVRILTHAANFWLASNISYRLYIYVHDLSRAIFHTSDYSCLLSATNNLQVKYNLRTVRSFIIFLSQYITLKRIVYCYIIVVSVLVEALGTASLTTSRNTADRAVIRPNMVPQNRPVGRGETKVGISLNCLKFNRIHSIVYSKLYYSSATIDYNLSR